MKTPVKKNQAGALVALAIALVAGALGVSPHVAQNIASVFVDGTGALSGEPGTGQGAGDEDNASSDYYFDQQDAFTWTEGAPTADTLASVPAYGGEPFVLIGATEDHPNGAPAFTDSELDRAWEGTFEEYSPLDEMGRCGTALACLGRETLPTGDRGSIREIRPTGWRQNFYDFVDQEALYNRCHLIAWSLAGENANAQNLITGTRSMNTLGMLPFEEETLSYIRRTGNHVLYRVTPIYKGRDMVARGAHMEARSIEDDGHGLSFNMYCHNVEPGVEIDYRTGENWPA